jgi:uncharacterized protein (DUF433 family)
MEYILVVLKNIVMTLVTEIINGEPYSYYPLGQYVVRAVGVCGDRPTFKYSRIEILGVIERLASGENIDEIVHGFRGRVSHEAIGEAIQVITTQFLENLPVLEAA